MKVLNEYLLSLESPGALAIDEPLSWTPVLTFATPGNLSVSYTTQVGDSTKIGREVFARFRIVTSAFTHTTATGDLQITGLPYTSNSDTGFIWTGPFVWGGITMAGGRTQCSCSLAAGSNIIKVSASGSGVAPTNITFAEMPTGGSVILRGSLHFRV